MKQPASADVIHHERPAGMDDETWAQVKSAQQQWFDTEVTQAQGSSEKLPSLREALHRIDYLLDLIENQYAETSRQEKS